METPMAVDEGRLRELIVESEDLQVDALRDAKEGIRDIAEVRHERLRNAPDPRDEPTTARRTLLRNGGLGLGAFTARGLFAGGIGAALAGIVASPAAAAGKDTDVMILQTAGSLETLAVATYKAALTLPFIKDGNQVVKAFAETTMKQHGEHNAAFGAMAKQLGGVAQTKPNAKYAQVVKDAMPGLTDPAAVVKLAMALEQVATQTYVNNMSLLEDKDTKALMASVMGVESQHLATLRAVGALLAGGAPELIAIPTDLAKLPAAAGSVEFPEPFEGTEKASPPEEGAVK
jgi:rubrerythrin